MTAGNGIIPERAHLMQRRRRFSTAAIASAVIGVMLSGCNDSSNSQPPTPLPTPGLNDRFSTVDISAQQDATIYEPSTGAEANGQGERLLVGITMDAAPRKLRALIRFPIDEAVPAGSEIAGTELCFSLPDMPADPVTLSLHRLRKDWQAGPADPAGDEMQGAPATDADVTWTRTGYGVAWDMAGGDYFAEADSIRTLGAEESGRVCLPNTGGTGNMNLTVRDWLDNPETNFGWILIADEDAANLVASFHSDDAADAALHPTLRVIYPN